MTDRELMQQALDALDDEFDRGRLQAERDWQQRVEPMRAEARAYKEAYFKLLETVAKIKAMEPGCPVFLATPPQGSPARRPLTDEEIDRVIDVNWSINNHKPTYVAHRAFARAIERAHKIGGSDD
jgi:hypothetical protein